MFEELVQELNLSEEQATKLNKVIQSETDKVRTEYSKKVKELESFKPVEKSAEQIELETLKKELADTKFQKSLKDIGVDDSLAKFIKSDCDIEELSTFVKGFAQVQKDFIPSLNMGDNSITKEQFKKMGIADKTKLYESNPELYTQLKQQ
jgi:hypothetical protein